MVRWLKSEKCPRSGTESRPILVLQICLEPSIICYRPVVIAPREIYASRLPFDRPLTVAKTSGHNATRADMKISKAVLDYDDVRGRGSESRPTVRSRTGARRRTAHRIIPEPIHPPDRPNRHSGTRDIPKWLPRYISARPGKVAEGHRRTV